MEIGLTPRHEGWRKRGARARSIPARLRALLDATVDTEDVVRVRGIRTDEDHQEARDTVSLARAYARSQGLALRVQPAAWDRQPTSDQSRVTSTIAFEMYRPKEATPE